MRLFIATGGKGTRLYPLTKELPKPMLPLNGKPVLEHLVEWARNNGFKELVFLNGYLHEIIENYFGDGKKFGVKIFHSNEPEPLGTGGALEYAKKYVKGRFALLNGDTICRVNIKRMLENHKKINAVMTVLLQESNHPQDSDLLKIDNNNRVIKFVSKTEVHNGMGNITNAGLMLLEPRIFDYLKNMTPKAFNFESYIFPKLLEAGEYINSHKTTEYVEDMGTPERLKKVENDLTKLA